MKLKNITSTIICLALSLCAGVQNAQGQGKEFHNWYFGEHVGMTWNTTQTIGRLFGMPTPLYGSVMVQNKGVFGMSDTNGNFLFYSNGITVWDKTHAVMTNGTGLTGDDYSAQSGIVIPYPGQTKKYIAVTVGLNSPNNTLAYSVIDMDGSGGLGEVMTSYKNIKLTGAVGVLGECVTAVRHANGTDYWIVAIGKGFDATSFNSTSALNVWKVTASGVQTACFASYPIAATDASATANGYLRFSADGKYFAWSVFNNYSELIFFGEFDPSTGTFPTVKIMHAGYNSYGVEFSPSSEILYVTHLSPVSREIHAYKFADLLAASIPENVSHRIVETGAAGFLSTLQLGPDGRIYGTVYNTTTMLVIDNVNDYDGFTFHLVDGLLPTGSGYAARIGLPDYSSRFFAPIEAPENIIDADCRTVPPAFVWGIRELPINTTTIDNYQQILTGDIDNDGEVEIIAYKDGSSITGNPTGGYDTDGLRMFVVRNGAVMEKRNWLFKDFSNAKLYASSLATCAIARHKGEAYVIVAATDKYLYAYNYDGTLRWKSDAIYTATGVSNDGVVGITDFNGDNIPDVWYGKRIFSLETGKLLCSFDTGNVGSWTWTAATDIDGDNLPEIVVGNQIYKVVITNPNGTGGNSITMMTGGYEYSGALPANIAASGWTHVADFDLDGELEVLVVTLTGGRSGAYLWKPNPSGTATLLGSYVGVSTSCSAIGPALVGNIDADPNPEAVYISNGNTYLMYALKYDATKPVGSRLVEKWTLAHTDGSGCTGMSLFDFDSDGKNEICYRDQATLRIIDGSGTSAYVASGNTFNNVTSGTRVEMPVIADVDGDGQAEMIINGHTSSQSETGYIRVFKAAVGGQWAAARKVWNTYAYRSLNVNDDLTIPTRQISHATRLAGMNGILGDSDDVFPFNNLFQQQTNLDVNGVPLWTLPRAQVDSTSYFYDAVKDSMFITVDVINAGNAPFSEPFHITVYKNAVGNAVKHTYTYPSFISEQDTAHITFGVSDYLASWGDADQLVIRANDAGKALNDQKVCDSLLRDKSADNIILALNDRAATITTTPVEIKVLANDSIPDGCTPTFSIIDPPVRHGTLTKVNNSVQYTAEDGFSGFDTVTYSIACNGNTSVAKAIIMVNEKPDNISDAECFIQVPPIEWSFKEITSSDGTGVLVDNSCIPLTGDIDNDGKIEIIVMEKGFHAQYVDTIHIFELDENNQLVVQQKIKTPAVNRVNNPYAIAKVDNNEYAALFFCTSHYANPAANIAATNGADALQLMKYVYDPVSGEYKFSWKATYSAQINREMGQPHIVDFNGDGVSEVLVLDKIFNAQTGELLVDGGLLSENNNGFGLGGHLITIHRWVNGSETTWSAIMAVGDIDGDNFPEVIGGKTVYKVSINNPNSQDGTNTFEVLRHVDTTGHPEAVDGATAIADMDGDGMLDVVVSGCGYVAGLSALYVWNPRTGDIMHDNVISDIPTITNEHSASVPFIGDIDGDGKPEICVTGKYVTKAFEFDATARTLTQKWSIVTTDGSVATGMTMFDFDQDGAQEIVYRDITHLRILNGVDGSDKIPPISCVSATGNEYPVVADVNGDHAAEIIVTSGLDGVGHETNGFLRIFGSATADNKWAPARKVWNQYAYNVVNINENLTVPKYRLNPATVFPGEDGTLGTGDDVRPYNGYLQQQTSLSYNGTTMWLAPNAKMVTEPKFDYDAGIDQATVNLIIANIGNAAFQAPFYVTVYRNSLSDSPKFVHAHDAMIYEGDTVNISIVIPNFKASGWIPFDHILIRTNDNGNGYTNQAVCDSTVATRDFETSSIISIDDRVMVVKNSADNRITVSINDLKSCFGSMVEIISGGGAKHGAANVVGDSVIFYTPISSYVGGDTVTYRIYCDNPTKADTAKVYISVVDLPDNVSDADCYVPAPASEWGIKVSWSSPNNIVSIFNTPFVGDLGNDGIPEIVCFGDANKTGTDATGMKLNTILIYNGKTHDLVTTISMKNDVDANVYVTGYDASAYGLVKRPSDNKGLIVVACDDYYLRAYDINGGSPIWTSDQKYASGTGEYAVNIGFADFNNDGNPEVYVRDKIYNASTGVLLATATGGNGNVGAAWAHHSDVMGHKLSSPIAADVLNDSRPELILGNEIYDVDITSPNAIGGNTINMIKDVTPPTGAVNDGFAQIADFNMDGHPDIFIATRSVAGASGTVAGYVWDVYNDVTSAPFTISTDHSGLSISLIGDIDNDGMLEILIQCGVSGTTKKYRCYKYNTGTNSFSFLWDFQADENTFSNSATMFDFNMDGMNEVLLSDQTKIRILNGSGKSHRTKQDTLAVYVMAEFSFGEVTIMQYPTIADVDADGHAEIIVVGNPNGVANTAYGSVNILKASNDLFPWAPARKVWNQYMYNAVNINEDLTVPEMQFNPAMVFPGADGFLGTSDDIRPYNNFLQQQTALNIKGSPFWLTPDVKFAEMPVATYYGDGDSLVISTKLTNIGDAELTAPFYISAYKNTVAATNKMATDSSTIALNVDDTISATVTIRNFSSYTSLTEIIVRINDKGGAAYVQQECEDNNNTFEYNSVGLPKAANDTIATLMNTPIIIDVKFNDLPPTACSSVKPEIAVGPTKGAHTVVNDKIEYTPASDFFGVDSLVYRLTCTTGKTEAKVYIVVNKPTAPTYIGCPGTNVPAGFTTVTNADVKYLWYTVETGGSPKDGIMDTRSCAAPSEWWVEAQYKGKPVKPRFKVTVNAYLALKAGSIGKDDTICYNTVPEPFNNVSSASEGHGITVYQWQYSENNGANWNDVIGATATSEVYVPTDELTQTTWYRRKATNDCGTVHTDSVKITVYPQSLENYSDLRIRVCPDVGVSINLSKYIDTLAVTSLQWKSVSPSIPIDPTTGTITTDNFNPYASVYTLAYTVDNPCISKPIERKVYLERLKSGRIRPLRDTVAVCYKLAERLQLNQLFGIEAAGTWSFDSSTDVTPYITRLTSSVYNGAVVMNGKAIYENIAHDYTYHDISTNRVKVTYTSDSNSCLKGKSYTITIILTPDITK